MGGKFEKIVKVTNKGVISIPAALRKKHQIKDGYYALMRETNDRKISLVLIRTEKSLRKRARSVEEFRKIYQQSKTEDLELEE